MTNIHADQNLRLAQKMLAQQGQINALTTALAEVTVERDRLRRENAALTDALDEFTHDFVTDTALPPNQCGWSEHGDGWDCTLSLRHPVHRTAAVVTAESEHGSRHALYRCPSCERVAPWTDGRLAAAGDPEDEFWCQTCGAETPLSACAVVRAELEAQP